MSRYILSLLCLFLAQTASGAASGAEFSASLSYTTDYTVLGISRSQGEGVFQGGVNLQTDNGFYASLWASQVEYTIASGAPTTPYPGYPATPVYQDQRDLELDIYVGYRQSLNENWRGDIMLARYTYPGANSTRDWAYTELLLGLHYRNRFSLALATSKNQFAADELTRSIAASTRLFTWQGFVSSAGAGYVDASALPNGYWYGQLAIARQFGKVQAEIIWHTTDNAARRFFGAERAGGRLEFRLSLSF